MLRFIIQIMHDEGKDFDIENSQYEGGGSMLGKNPIFKKMNDKSKEQKEKKKIKKTSINLIKGKILKNGILEESNIDE